MRTLNIETSEFVFIYVLGLIAGYLGIVPVTETIKSGGVFFGEDHEFHDGTNLRSIQSIKRTIRTTCRTGLSVAMSLIGYAYRFTDGSNHTQWEVEKVTITENGQVRTFTCTNLHIRPKPKNPLFYFGYQKREDFRDDKFGFQC